MSFHLSHYVCVCLCVNTILNTICYASAHATRGPCFLAKPPRGGVRCLPRVVYLPVQRQWMLGTADIWDVHLLQNAGFCCGWGITQR